MSPSEIDLELVRAEIADEVCQRRSQGAFDATKERQLEALFHQYAPMSGHGGALSETLRAVDATAYINPVVPIESEQPAGEAVKKVMRKAALWYVTWISDQTTKALSTVARSLHLIDEELIEIRDRLDQVSVSSAPVVELEGLSDPSSWWVERATAALGAATGRILVSACGDGWLVRSLDGDGVDAYGIDPRSERIKQGEIEGLDLRDDDLLVHLRSVADARLGGMLLTGTTEAMLPSQRQQLLGLVDQKLGSPSVLVIHAARPESLAGDELPAVLDMAGARPMRPESWGALLHERGFDVEQHRGPDGRDALVVATRGIASRTS